MLIIEDVKLDYDDVLIIPKRSKISSRSDVDINREYKFLHSGISWKGFPVIAANMDCTGTFFMAKVLAEENMITCLHKYYEQEDLVDFFVKNQGLWKSVFYTIGTKQDDLKKLSSVKERVKSVTGRDDFPTNLCVDAANGYTENFDCSVRKIRSIFPTSVLMAGNVVTPNMVEQLIQESGVDIVKIGIGPGQVCTTRITTGIGFPQLSSVLECADAAHGLKGHICADGGCKHPGDVVKAFAAGADFCMLGGMLAGTDECEGEWEYDPKYDTIETSATKSIHDKIKIIPKAKSKLKFYGMSSENAMDKYNGGLGEYRAEEGKEIWVDYKGPVKKVIQQIKGGVRSACAYVGAEKLKHLNKRTTFIRVNRVHSE